MKPFKVSQPNDFGLISESPFDVFPKTDETSLFMFFFFFSLGFI